MSRGAAINPDNKYHHQQLSTIDLDGLDEAVVLDTPTSFYFETPKSILSKNNSQDVPFTYSINPYQGCEHGCIYCYARNSHEYWGFSAGIDFESKIVVKKNAPELLEKAFLQPTWKPQTVVLSGNTDCYQPAEKHYGITRKLLEVALKYRNPVGLITKNALVLRDIDVLSELAAMDLVHVYVSITTLDEEIRRKMEPRTVTGERRLDIVEKLHSRGVPVGVMVAPIVPWINHTEIPTIIERAAEAGAQTASYTVVRLNGAVGELFTDWLLRHFPDRATRVLTAIGELHGGEISDSQAGRRMRGDGEIAKVIKQLFDHGKRKHFVGRAMPEYNLNLFRARGHYRLFE